MKILVIGGGGREHALIWKISQSPRVEKIYCAPGNAGISGLATCIPIETDDIDGLYEFAVEEAVDLTVVGPEVPLEKGIVDRFEGNGLKIFGVDRQAARLETSKAFAKNIMTKYGIPTARGRSFDVLEEARAYIDEIGPAVVVKADGLAAGKGVFVCATEKQAQDALKQVMIDKVFGEAGKRVVIEERLAGEEVSFLVLTDGETVLPLPCSQDHKTIFDGDQGPNTGGMGAYSPAPVIDEYLHRKIMDTIMLPTVRAMATEGTPFKGVLYAGLMVQDDRIHVLEFNVRFGDPETQPLMMRIKNDIVPVMEAVCNRTLHECSLDIDERAAVCVVMTAGGYPGAYKKGLPISGLANAARMKEIVVFHAGTRAKGKSVLTDGGRVLGVTALGETIAKAIARAYEAVSKISWEGAYYRKDIGGKALRREGLKPQVAIIMGSDSDLPVMQEAAGVLKRFNISYEMAIASAHRTPARAAELAETARQRGIRVIIAGAGMAAHLAGSLAAHTTLPIIGVPIHVPPLNGLDALLSTVQMPPGVPVATMAIGKPGAKNAGLLAVQILAVSDEGLAGKLKDYKQEMSAAVAQKDKQLHEARP